MPKPRPFVFNDQNKRNSYGFRILTSGISLSRFSDNPMMLNDHWNSTLAVIGKWENVRVEKDLLMADPDFDIEDTEAAKIAGRVERNYIKTCSMGITFDRADLKLIGDELIMEKCELYEVSIVAVPSNAGSIRLYADNGKQMSKEEVQQLCLSLTPSDDPGNINEPEAKKLELNNPIDMKKIILTLGAMVALGFDKSLANTELDVAEFETRVLALSKENAELTAAKLAHEAASESAAETKLEKVVGDAVLAGKISAEKADDFKKIGRVDLALLESTLEGIPAKQTLGTKVTPGASGEVATKADFQKLSADAQLAFKNEKPEEYKKLFNSKK